MLKIIGVSLIIISAQLIGQVSLKSSTYFLPVEFSDVSKNAQSISGAHVFLGLGLSHSIDAGFDFISDENGKVQQMTAANYIYYGQFPYRYRVGWYGVQMDDYTVSNVNYSSPNQGYTGIFGIDMDHFNTYGTFLWTTGFNVYYTSHESLISDTLTPFSVTQVSTHFKVPMYSTFYTGSILSTTTLNFQAFSQALVDNETFYTWLEQEFKYFTNRFGFEVSIWAGNSVYSMQKVGYALNNTTDVYLYGGQVGLTLFFSKHLNLKLSYLAQKYENSSESIQTVSKPMVLLGISL